MLTLKPEYIAMLVFGDLCALICTMCMAWVVLRLGTLMSLRSYLSQGQGGAKAVAKVGRNGKARKSAGWDDEIFGAEGEVEPQEEQPSRGRVSRSAQVAPEPADDPPDDQAEPVLYTEDDVLVLMKRARDEQRKADEAEFAKVGPKRAPTVRPPAPRGAQR